MKSLIVRLELFIRRLVVGIGLALASVAICLLFLEVSVRVLNGVPVFTTVNFVGLELDQMHKGAGFGAYDPQLGWVQRANAKSADFNTGDFGARMPSKEIVPLRQGAILMVGDSFGVGSEVSDSESWPAYLERSLGEQVINAGVGGYGLDQIVLRAELLVPKLKPRTLIVETRPEFGLSVARMNLYGGTPKPFFTIAGDELVKHNDPVPQVATGSVNIGKARSVFGHSYLVQYIMTRLNLLQWWVKDINWPNYVLSDADGVKLGCILMRRLSEMRDQHNMRVILLLQYAAVDVMSPTLPFGDDIGRVVTCARDERLEVVDTLETLRTSFRAGDLAAYQKLWKMSGNNMVYGHMSAKGNLLIAELLQQHLKKDKAASNGQ